MVSDFDEINTNDPGVPNLKYGSNHLLEVFKLLNGKVVANREVKIQTPWYWQIPLRMLKQTGLPANPPTDHVLIYPDSSTGRLMAHKSSGTRVELENIITTLQDLTDTQFTNLTNGDSFKWNAATSKWINAPFPTGVWNPTGTETLQNKTASVNLNIINHSTTNNIGDLLANTGTKFDRFARGSALQLLRVNSAGTGIEWFTLTTTGGEVNTASNVGTAGVGVYKTKNVYDLQFKKINAASSKITVTDNTGASQVDLDVAQANLDRNSIGGASPLSVANGGSGAATLTGIVRGNGASAMTAVGLGNSGDVLTNVGGTPSFQPPAATGGGGTTNPALGPKTGQVQAGGGPVTAGSILGSGLCHGWKTAALTSGTVTTDIDADGQFIALNSSTSTSQTNSEINSVLATIFRTDLNPKIWIKIKMPASIVNTRAFIGFTDLIALPQNQSVFIQNQNGFGWNYDTSSQASIQLVTNNANSTVNLVDTSLAPVLNQVMNLKIEFISSTSTAKLTIDGTPFTTTTKVPASTAKLGFLCREQNTAGSLRTMNVYYIYAECDK
jgi:hypothetical protein